MSDRQELAKMFMVAMISNLGHTFNIDDVKWCYNMADNIILYNQSNPRE